MKTKGLLPEQLFRLGKSELDKRENRSDRTAAKLLKMAAKMGNVDAQFLYLVYFFGRGVLRSQKKGMDLAFKAADNGHAEVQFDVANFYLLSKTIPYDHRQQQALRYLKMSAAQGFQKAIDQLRNM
jgi:hypothetical protein